MCVCVYQTFEHIWKDTLKYLNATHISTISSAFLFFHRFETTRGNFGQKSSKYMMLKNKSQWVHRSICVSVLSLWILWKTLTLNMIVLPSINCILIQQKNCELNVKTKMKRFVCCWLFVVIVAVWLRCECVLFLIHVFKN